MSHLLRQIDEINRPARMISEMVRNPVLEEVRRIEEARKMAIGPFSAISEYQTRMEAATNAIALGLPPSLLETIQTFENMTRASSSFEAVMRPTPSATQILAAQVAGLMESHHRFLDATSWSTDLERRMHLIDGDWASSDHVSISGLSFARLSQLSDLVRYDAPFSEETSEIVVAQLGQVVEEPSEDTNDREAQYDEAGRNPALVAFPQESYSSVVIASGFQLTFPAAPVPEPIENIAGGVVLDDVHHVAMREIENHLRALIMAQLSSVEPHWVKRRVPGAMLKKWAERQDVDRALKNPVYELIYYSDFGDLGQIITQSNNWPLFAPLFGARDNLLVSIRRLIPVRNTIAHGRPLTPTDILNIVAEGQRLLRAIGQIILN